MEFKKLKIKNFRNFKEIEITLANKNIILGLNDVGKSNFLSAIRFVFDNSIRRNGFLESDYFNKDVSQNIEILIELDIKDENDDDNKKLYSKIKGATDTDLLCIKLIAEFDNNNLTGNPILKWGPNEKDLEDIPCSGYIYELDKVINLIYIDSSVQMDKVFKRYTKNKLKDKNIDENEKKKLNDSINNLNTCIGELKNIKDMEVGIAKVYKDFRDERNVRINIKSEIEVENLYSKLIPYMGFEEGKYYPTSGDGRTKLLEYTLITLESEEVADKKINIFLIEELENHLHKSMQIALSYQLFQQELFKYMFITTHSDSIIKEMDEVNLIKLLDNDKEKGRACYYKVPEEYRYLKKKLNENLTAAIFYDTVLLVEGPSEKVLFEYIMSIYASEYESEGAFILTVDGINFKDYYRILKALNINVIVKTDNDFKVVECKDKDKNKINRCSYIGINRGLELLDMKKIEVNIVEDKEKYRNNHIAIKHDIYNRVYNKEIKILMQNKIFISKVDLENDLYDIVPNVFERIFAKGDREGNVKKMQDAKLINMIEFCKNLEKDHCDKIIEYDGFKCIKELIEYVKNR